MTRLNDLAKIHIAKKDLGIDEETYRIIIKNIGGSKTGSAKELTETGRGRVIGHFRKKGWKPKVVNKKRSKKAKSIGFATEGQIQFIKIAWDKMYTANVVRVPSDAGLRKWLLASTRHYHPQKVGYDAPEFLPPDVAIKIIEHMKQWAARYGVKLS